MAEEIIRFGAGGVPYKPTTPLASEPEKEVEVEEVPAVTVKVIEIFLRKRKNENI